jgi:hypothetical protein
MSSDEKLILDSFSRFVTEQKLIEPADLEYLIDDTIGAYIVNAIRNFYAEYENHKAWLDEDSVDLVEDLDLDSFAEIIDAYLVGFSSLDISVIFNWLIKLKKEIEASTEPPQKEAEEEVAQNSEQEKAAVEASSESCLLDEDQHFGLLLDMFPEVDRKEIAKCYQKFDRNHEKCIDELLMREDCVIIDDDKLTEKERRELKEKTLQRWKLFC